MHRPEEGEGSTVNPWVETLVDSSVQTGGDWYQILLAASMGYKAVHGANTAPTCEVLCKTNRAQFDLDNYGTISWDETISKPYFLGYDISDKFYSHHQYRGNITASGSILAYESGLWEPSVRRRARSSALLAAGIAVHGCSKLDACDIVSRIAGEQIDIEAVDGAILPASHLKREMVLVSKATHRLFSRGSLQSAILWHDAKLNCDSTYRNVAFDWGRVTAIARYIAEANIQNCPYFLNHAWKDGIPYSVVRNAWAYVSDSDYRIPPELFKDVPKINVTDYGMPSLKGTFIGHEQDVMLALNRAKKSGVSVPESDAFRAYIDLMKEAKKRRGRRDKTGLASSSEVQIVSISEHTVTAENVLDLIEGSRMVRTAYLTAIASRRKCDPPFDQLMSKVSQTAISDAGKMKEVDDASIIIYDKSLWILARVFAENALKTGTGESEETRDRALNSITLQLSSMRSSIVGYPTHLDTHLVLSTSQLVEARSATIAYARDSGKALPTVTYSQRSLVSRQLQEASSALNQFGTRRNPVISQIREEVSAIYEEWYTDAMKGSELAVKHAAAHYALIVAFLRGFNEHTCFQKASGYIDGTQPRRSYVYQGLIRLSRDLEFEPPLMKRFSYTDAHQLSLEMDLSGKLPISMREAVAEVIEVADDVVGDLMLGKLWKPDPQTYMDLHMKYAPIGSPGYDTTMMVDAELLAMADALIRDQEENRKVRFATGYTACLNTYPSEALGDKYARVMGYPNLRAAFDLLGTDVYYSEENQFIHDARAKIGFGLGSESSSTSGSKRSYGEVM